VFSLSRLKAVNNRWRAGTEKKSGMNIWLGLTTTFLLLQFSPTAATKFLSLKGFDMRGE
jgi:hypothetical protein